jgi:hypothetical protein
LFHKWPYANYAVMADPSKQPCVAERRNQCHTVPAVRSRGAAAAKGSQSEGRKGSR